MTTVRTSLEPPEAARAPRAVPKRHGDGEARRSAIAGEPPRDAAASRGSSTAAWISVLGTLAIVAALALGREFLVPLALAGLLTFVLSPPVQWLERRIGRLPAVLGVVAVVFALLLGAGWVLVRQLEGVTSDLPRYRVTLVRRMAELQASMSGGTVGELQKTIDTVQNDLATAAGGEPETRVVIAERAVAHSPFGVLGPVAGLAASAGLVISLVIFMLLERRDLRDRIVELAGRGHVALTTRALDEAGSRVARQLLMQTLVNAVYGVIAGVGLWLLEVPYPVVWATLGGVLRFVPYVGPLIGASSPVLIAVAAMEDWSGPISVAALMVALELFTNLVLETVLYAGAAGVSQVGLLTAVTFWTWVWGPVGLVMAIPLTVCVVVIGKHVRGLEYLATLMADTPALSPARAFYQRLLSRDTSEASEIIERHVAEPHPRTVYDTLILPALTEAETDRLRGRLDVEGQRQFVTAAREMVIDAAEQVARAEPDRGERLEPSMRLLGYGMNDQLDDVALEAFARLIDDLPITLDVHSKLLASDIAEWMTEHGMSAICIADLPPSTPSRTRYLVKRLRKAAPDLVIMVGRWGATTNDDVAELMAAGANHVATTFQQSRIFLTDPSTAHRLP